MSKYTTEQEAFWAGEFGNNYIERNQSATQLAGNLQFFVNALRAAGRLTSCLEMGANIGMNLKAMRLLYPTLPLKAIEINPEAARHLADTIGPDNVWNGSIFDYPATETFDLVLIKGVLIHLNPDRLPDAYDKLYRSSKRLILVGEYYNTTPVAIPYRGHNDRLFKRDFAGEMLAAYPDLRLVDYGFAYRGDPAFEQDDVTWFLLEKRG